MLPAVIVFFCWLTCTVENNGTENCAEWKNSMENYLHQIIHVPYACLCVTTTIQDDRMKQTGVDIMWEQTHSHRSAEKPTSFHQKLFRESLPLVWVFFAMVDGGARETEISNVFAKQ